MNIQRPYIIIVLSIFHVFWGLLVLLQNSFYSQVLIVSSVDFRSQLLLIVVVTVILHILSVFAGVGIYFQKRAGWSLSMFYFTYRFFETVQAFFQVDFLSYNLAYRTEKDGDLIIYYLSRILFFSTMVLFLLLNSQLGQYFSLTSRFKVVTFTICFLLAIGLFLLTDNFSGMINK